MTTNPFAITATDLVKVFPPERRGDPPHRALDGLTLEIPRGAFYGLLGRNGEGKSTLLRCLLGLLNPTSGTAEILGMTYANAAPADRARVAYVPQRHQLAGSMTLRQYCTFYQYLFPAWDQPYAAALAQRMELSMDRTIRSLSGGVQRKVSICLALASRAEVLLLDEPAAGLDPIARSELIGELIDVMSTVEGVTMLFSTHILSDLEHLADHIGILAAGKMALSVPLDQLKRDFRRIQIICPSDAYAAGIAIPEALRLQCMGRVINASVQQVDAVCARLQQEWPEAAIETFALPLDELFVELVQSNRFQQLELQEVA